MMRIKNLWRYSANNWGHEHMITSAHSVKLLFYRDYFITAVLYL